MISVQVATAPAALPPGLRPSERAGEAGHLLLGRRHGGVVGRQVGRLLGQLAGVAGAGGEGGVGVVLELPAHAEGGGAVLQGRRDGRRLLVGLAGLQLVDVAVEIAVGPAVAGVRAVGLLPPVGLVVAEAGLLVKVVRQLLAPGDEGVVGLGDVGRVAGGVHGDLAGEESIGEVLELSCPLVTVLAATGHVGLVTSTDVHKAMGGRCEESLLAVLVASGLVLLHHPLPLLLEVAHDVLPDLHVVHGLLKAFVVQYCFLSGCLFPLGTVVSVLPLSSVLPSLPSLPSSLVLPLPPGVWTPGDPNLRQLLRQAVGFLLPALFFLFLLASGLRATRTSASSSARLLASSSSALTAEIARRTMSPNRIRLRELFILDRLVISADVDVAR